MCLSRHTNESRQVWNELGEEFDAYKVIREDNGGGMLYGFPYQTGLNKPVEAAFKFAWISGHTPEAKDSDEPVVVETAFGCFKDKSSAKKALSKMVPSGVYDYPYAHLKVIKVRVRKFDVIHCGVWEDIPGLALHVKALWINSLDKVT